MVQVAVSLLFLKSTKGVFNIYARDMRLRLFHLVHFFLCGSIVFGQWSPEQERMIAVNPCWKHLKLSAEQSQQVKQRHSHTSLIQLHLKWIAEHLTSATQQLDLDEATRGKRQEMIEALTSYYQRNLFPLNTISPDPTPVFVDEAGTHCAVGYLLHVSGYDEVVSEISRQNNLGYVHELHKQFPVLDIWAEEFGFSVDELAWIQPQYSFFCNPSIQLGEVIHVTCPGDCNGAFFPDPFEVINEPGVFIQVGSVYEWSNEEWKEISAPDCLCPGRYKQDYILTSQEMDTTFIVSIEVEIESPEPIFTSANLEGEAGICRAYIEPETEGGTPPYTYDLLDMDSNVYNMGPLCQGEYFLITTDSMGCSVGEQIYVYTEYADCQLFCVTDIQLNQPDPGSMAVTLYFNAPGDVFINYPYFSLVFDENKKVIATGDLDFFGQFGGTSQTYTLQTTLDSLPDEFKAHLSFEYNEDRFCYLPYPCPVTSLRAPDMLEMMVFPNPFSSEAMIQLDESLSGGQLMLFNMQGQQVRSLAWPDGDQFIIKRDGLPSGPYLLLLSAPGKTTIIKYILMD